MKYKHRNRQVNNNNIRWRKTILSKCIQTVDLTGEWMFFFKPGPIKAANWHNKKLKVAAEEEVQYFWFRSVRYGCIWTLSTSEPGCKAGLCFVHHILAALPAPQLSWNPAFATCCYRQAEEGVPTVRETPASPPPPRPPKPPTSHFLPSTPLVFATLSASSPPRRSSRSSRHVWWA